tara:strand:- start:10069 stop:10833 length:765 start_codon:yes stop_codon:yes gene_type:complete
MITGVKMGTEELSAPPFFFGIGSCFVSNLDPFLSKWGYKYQFNPLGTSFNPISISKQLRWIFCNKELSPNFNYQGIFHQLDAANKWQGKSDTVLKEYIEKTRNEIKQYLNQSGKKLIFVISLGTSHAWFKGNQLVNNCHKLPGHFFERRLLNKEEIVTEWKHTLSKLPENLKIIFTVSPVRYTRIGLQENFLGKSILRTAIEELLLSPKVVYFPSFEIINDELRDYSFFESNGTHPNSKAIEVVMERFKTFLDL